MDVFNLPSKENNFKVFYTNGGGNSWQTWTKPKNTKLIFMYLIGGGGGGGAGVSTTAVSSNSGGGGGGSSSVSMGLFPAILLPDTLYIQVGQGGVGGIPVSGTTGRPGSGGTLSHISLEPNTSLVNLILSSGNAVAGGGNAGISNGTVTGGAAGTAFIQTNSIISYLGNINTVVGEQGSAGTGASNGASLAATTINLPTSAGLGGGGINVSSVAFNGGSSLAGSFVPLISGGLAGGNNGSNGFTSLPSLNMGKLPMFFMGGAGGGANATIGGIGGNGGNGSFGSGGGGGGAARGLGGIGGNGGDGLVIITCF